MLRLLALLCACAFSSVSLAAQPAAAPATGPLLRPAATPRPTNWEQAWDFAWVRAHDFYRIHAAPTLVTDPLCSQPLALSDTVKQTVAAVQARRYGDALRLTGAFQERQMCLTREGARGLELALTLFVHRALAQLPPDQARVAVHGTLNLGMLSFDQLQYTRSSWWLPLLRHEARQLAPHLASYPRELGLLMYDGGTGLLVQAPLMAEAVAAMSDPRRFGDGRCSLLDMSRNGFNCSPGAAGGKLQGGGKAGATSGAGGMALPKGGTLACSISAAQASGMRGTLACMQRATAGMSFDPRAPKDLLQGQPGLRDPHCALSQDSGTKGSAGTQESGGKTTNNEPPWYEKLAAAVWAVATAFLDKTPDPLPSADLASKEGADAVKNTLIFLQEVKNKDNLLKDEGAADYYKNRENRTAQPADVEGRRAPDAPDPLGTGGSGCSAASNAAQRVNALMACTAGSIQPSQPTTTPGGTGPIALTSEPTAKITGVMACMTQGGDFMRSGVNDPKCAAMRCAEGAACPCNKPGPGAGLSPANARSGGVPTDLLINCSGSNTAGRTGQASPGDPCGNLRAGGSISTGAASQPALLRGPGGTLAGPGAPASSPIGPAGGLPLRP